MSANQPETVDELLAMMQQATVQHTLHLTDDTNGTEWEEEALRLRDKAKAALSAMVAEIIGESRPYSKLEECPVCHGRQYACSCDDAEDKLLAEQRQRATAKGFGMKGGE